MKKTITILSTALLLCTSILMSCSSEEKAQVTVFDGEFQWPSIMKAQLASGTNEAGDVVIWGPMFQTEIDNSLRGIQFLFNTTEPGTYSGIYDAAKEKWSNSAISVVTMTIDYDGQPYPRWYGHTANLTIHNFDKKTNIIDATIEALMVMEGTSNSHNIKVDFRNYKVKGE